MGAPVDQSSRPGGARRGRAEAGDFQDLALVERLGLQERGGERDQLVAVRGEQAGRFALALLDDAPHLGVDQLGGRLAVGLAWKAGESPSSCAATKLIGPSFSLIPQRSTIWRAISVTCRRSFSPPVVTTP